MGCDIHLHIEVKIDGVWQHWGNPNISRNYAMFSAMVGVRAGPGDGMPIGGLNGIPEDATVPTRYDCDAMRGDGHSHAWFNLAQIEAFGKWFDAQPQQQVFGMEGKFGYLLGNSWSLDPRHPRISDIRFVFWFDN